MPPLSNPSIHRWRRSSTMSGGRNVVATKNFSWKPRETKGCTKGNQGIHQKPTETKGSTSSPQELGETQHFWSQFTKLKHLGSTPETWGKWGNQACTWDTDRSKLQQMLGVLRYQFQLPQSDQVPQEERRHLSAEQGETHMNQVQTRFTCFHHK